MQLFSDDMRRDPYPFYALARAETPFLHHPATNLRMVFDYATVDRVLTDHENFSSRFGPDWMIFTDPPRHARLRSLISKAFTPRSIAALESRIARLARELLAPHLAGGHMDLAADFAVPLPTTVIAEMLGLPSEDRARLVRWNEVVLASSYSIGGPPDLAAAAMTDFVAATAEMSAYLAALLDRRRAQPTDDLLTRLSQADVDGQRLTHNEILGFFQLLLLAGSETTTNLLTNAILCFIDHPAALAAVRANPALLPGAIEEVLRYRSPLQWIYRRTTREVELHGQSIPPKSLVLTMIGSANRDPAAFPDPDCFDITRTPNPHLAFGHGSHFCLGAPLAQLEGRIVLTELLRLRGIESAEDGPWPPRRGIHVLGPARLKIEWSESV